MRAYLILALLIATACSPNGPIDGDRLIPPILPDDYAGTQPALIDIQTPQNAGLLLLTDAQIAALDAEIVALQNRAATLAPPTEPNETPPQINARRTALEARIRALRMRADAARAARGT